MRPLVLYTAGPYSGGAVAKNIQAARKVAIEIWERGHVALCPHLNTQHFEQDCKVDYDAYIRGDLMLVDRCDGVVLLPGWEDSKGAKIEQGYAARCGLPIWVYPELPESPDGDRGILERAWELTSGPRKASYGHALDDFTRTGQLWGTLLGLPGPVSPELVGLCMIAVKLSREVHRHKEDNLVDMAGYANTVMQVVDERVRRANLVAQRQSGRMPSDATRQTHGAARAPECTPCAEVTDDASA